MVQRCNKYKKIDNCLMLKMIEQMTNTKQSRPKYA